MTLKLSETLAGLTFFFVFPSLVLALLGYLVQLKSTDVLEALTGSAPNGRSIISRYYFLLIGAFFLSSFSYLAGGYFTLLYSSEWILHPRLMALISITYGMMLLAIVLVSPVLLTQVRNKLFEQ